MKYIIIDRVIKAFFPSSSSNFCNIVYGYNIHSLTFWQTLQQVYAAGRHLTISQTAPHASVSDKIEEMLITVGADWTRSVR